MRKVRLRMVNGTAGGKPRHVEHEYPVLEERGDLVRIPSTQDGREQWIDRALLETD